MASRGFGRGAGRGRGHAYSEAPSTGWLPADHTPDRAEPEDPVQPPVDPLDDEAQIGEEEGIVVFDDTGQDDYFQPGDKTSPHGDRHPHDYDFF